VDHRLAVIFSGLLAGGLWTAAMTVLGMPISGTHSLVGGIIGAAVASHGIDILVGENVGETLLAMLIAPVMGFVVAYVFYGALMTLSGRLRPSTLVYTFGKLQILSAGWMAFAHGTNDAQKVMGIITLALIVGGFQVNPGGASGAFDVLPIVRFACAAIISIGTAVGGWKVIKTLGHHLAKLEPPEGFAAETSASLVLSLAAWAHVPTSSTHTITGAILGVGATRGITSVSWGLGEKILLAWVFTLPSTAALGGALYWVMTTLVG
jgi:PiT family inorganic phosphate transporter